MKYRIANWYGHEPPVSEAVKVGTTPVTKNFGKEETGEYKGVYEVEIDDLHVFALKHGQIKLVPPGGAGRGSQKEQWFIWVTTDNNWNQR